MAYEGSVELISGIKTKNNGTFPLVDAPDIRVTDDLRLPGALDLKADKATKVNGHALSSDVTITKSDVGLGNCDNTSDDDKPISMATQEALNLKAPLASPVLTGTPKSVTPVSDSDSKMIATKEYVDNAFTVNDAMLFKGTIGTAASGATVNVLPDTHKQGWTYKVITTGSYAGKPCEIGDMIICVADGTTANNDDWTVVQTNIDGAVTGPVSSIDGHVALFNGNGGKVIKDGGTIQSLLIDDTAGDGSTTKVWSADKNVDQLALKVDKTVKVNDHVLSSDVTVTKSDVGLANVDNTADIDKPVSTAQQAALNLKADKSTTINGHPLSSNVTVIKSDVGLGNVDNTADTDKPVSTAQQAALDLKANAQDVADAFLDNNKKNLLQLRSIPGTVQSVVFDQNGQVTKFVHINQNGSDIVRTDVFSFDTNSITEIRTLSTGETLTTVFDSQQLTTTATYASA